MERAPKTRRREIEINKENDKMPQYNHISFDSLPACTKVPSPCCWSIVGTIKSKYVYRPARFIIRKEPARVGKKKRHKKQQQSGSRKTQLVRPLISFRPFDLIVCFFFPVCSSLYSELRPLSNTAQHWQGQLRQGKSTPLPPVGRAFVPVSLIGLFAA